MMRRNLTRYRQAFSLSARNKVKAVRRCDVLNVKRAAREAAQLNVARNFNFFTGGRPA
jgi:hypothetical protein